MSRKRADEVFGVNPDILVDSYVDRGSLDSKLHIALGRTKHISLVGPSKSGKSWLRKKQVPNAIVIQCGFNKTVDDIYKEALAELGISLIVSESSTTGFSGSVQASAEGGKSLIVKVMARLGLELEASYEQTSERKPLIQDISNLRFVSDLILASERRLVIEDIHYLSQVERKRLSFDLKSLWDFGLYVIIIGIWPRQSLTSLNPDLTRRVAEYSLEWTNEELESVIENGTGALDISFSEELEAKIVQSSYHNAGLLQDLTLSTLDKARVDSIQERPFEVDDIDYFLTSAKEYASSLNTRYQDFAKRTSKGLRKRPNSTLIYAYAMWAIMRCSSEDLIKGVSVRTIFEASHEREPRILLPNLRSILQKIDGLQVDSEGRGLVVTYDEGSEEVTVVDPQVLFYRDFMTVSWPWDEMIVDRTGLVEESFAADEGEQE